MDRIQRVPKAMRAVHRRKRKGSASFVPTTHRAILVSPVVNTLPVISGSWKRCPIVNYADDRLGNIPASVHSSATALDGSRGWTISGSTHRQCTSTRIFPATRWQPQVHGSKDRSGPTGSGHKVGHGHQRPGAQALTVAMAVTYPHRASHRPAPPCRRCRTYRPSDMIQADVHRLS